MAYGQMAPRVAAAPPGGGGGSLGAINMTRRPAAPGGGGMVGIPGGNAMGAPPGGNMGGMMGRIGAGMPSGATPYGQALQSSRVAPMGAAPPAPPSVATPTGAWSFGAGPGAPGGGSRSSARNPRGAVPQGGVPADQINYPVNAGREYALRGGNPNELGGKQFFRQLRNKAPGFLQDQGAFMQGMENLKQIMASQGKIDPTILGGMQADAEMARQQGQQAVMARLAQSGIDPSSPQGQAVLAANEGTANSARAEAGRYAERLAAERMRSDMGQLTPFMSSLLQYTTKRGGNISTAAPSGGGGVHPDYLGAASNLIGTVGPALINKYG